MGAGRGGRCGLVGASSMADMGAVMGRAMGELRGRADGNRVREMVESLLGS